MTTNVIVNAHCANDKEVKIRITDTGELAKEITLQDGESIEQVVYDDLVISVWEEEKALSND